MPRHKPSRKSVHRIASDYPDDDDVDYSQTPSTNSTPEDEGVLGTARNSILLSKESSTVESFTDRQPSVRASSESPASSPATPNPEKDLSQPRRILNSITRRILDAVSYLLNAVGVIFSRHTGKDRSRRLTFPSTDSDPVIAEIHAYGDIIYWRRDNHTHVFKRNPEKCTVFEIKQDDDPDQEKPKKKEPSFPKSKETIPLGTTVYRQPARGICIGSQQVSGAVKVVLDYNQKRAFVQLISRKSEVYATYTVESITFLTTCTPFGVAWIGDTFKPEDSVPGSEKEQKQSSFAGQRQRSDTKPSKSFEMQKNENHPTRQVTDQDTQTNLAGTQDGVPKSETVPQKSIIKSSPKSPEPAIVNQDIAPRQVKSKRVETDSTRTSTSEQLRQTERELMKHIRAEQYNKEHPTAKKQVPSRASGSGVSNSEEEISIDVAHVVFSNPMQAQRLKHIVAALKGALGCGGGPESATFQGSNFSLASSSEVSSATVDQLSPMSNDLKSEMSLPAGYYNLPFNDFNFEGSQGLPHGVARHADVAQRLYFNSTESPEQARYRNNYSFHKDQQQNVAGKVFPIQNADSSQEQQNGAQRTTNKESQKPALNSHVEPGGSNGAQRTPDNVSQKPAPNSQVEPGVSSGAQRIPSNVSQKPASNSQVQPSVSNGAQRIPSNVSQQPAPNSQVQPGVSNVAQSVLQEPHLQDDQNKVPSKSLHENNFSLEKQNLADVQKLQTGSTQNLHQVQNQPVFFNQNPRHELNTMLPISTIPNQQHKIQDPRLTSYLTLGTVGNQMPWTFGNQMPSTFCNQMPVSLGNQIPQVLRKDHLSALTKFGHRIAPNNMRRIHRNMDPSSIRRHWSTSHAKPCNAVKVCWLTDE